MAADTNRNTIALILAILLALAVATWLLLKDKSASHSGMRPLIGDTEEMGNSSPSVTNDVIVWRMDFDETNNVIKMGYSQVGRYTIQSGQIDEFLKAAAVKFPQRPDGGDWRDVKWETRPGPPNETALSLSHNGYSHMVFLLPDMNWHFTPGRDPFEVREKKGSLYTRPMCAWKISATAAKVGRKPPANARCRVASFISNARKDKGKEPRFVTPFNFYISAEIAGPDGAVRQLPFVIDPDVGHPGGNAPGDIRK